MIWYILQRNLENTRIFNKMWWWSSSYYTFSFWFYLHIFLLCLLDRDNFWCHFSFAGAQHSWQFSVLIVITVIIGSKLYIRSLYRYHHVERWMYSDIYLYSMLHISLGSIILLFAAFVERRALFNTHISFSGLIKIITIFFSFLVANVSGLFFILRFFVYYMGTVTHSTSYNIRSVMCVHMLLHW